MGVISLGSFSRGDNAEGIVGPLSADDLQRDRYRMEGLPVHGLASHARVNNSLYFARSDCFFEFLRTRKNDSYYLAVHYPTYEKSSLAKLLSWSSQESGNFELATMQSMSASTTTSTQP